MIFISLFWRKWFPLIKNSSKERKNIFFLLWFLWINPSNHAKKVEMEIKLTCEAFLTVGEVIKVKLANVWHLFNMASRNSLCVWNSFVKSFLASTSNSSLVILWDHSYITYALLYQPQHFHEFFEHFFLLYVLKMSNYIQHENFVKM